MRKLFSAAAALMIASAAVAQTFTAVTSTEGGEWRESKVKAERKAAAEPLLELTGNEEGTPFDHWGHCFNELAWDALCLLPEADRDDYKAPTGKTFPNPLSQTDYMIQDPRYLQAYADFFSRFITEYAAEGINIGMVMYQNEAWSYTPYPGCAWTPEGIIRFNTQYLAPTMRRDHPEVQVYFGTINTNRLNIIDQVLSDTAMAAAVSGVGLQWEGGQLLPALRKKYPKMRFVQTESECGWGAFDWRAAEHTFERINHYLGNGCEDYTFWNAILADNGVSTWGWKQNALVRVDSKKRTYTLTPEYYAVRHYAQFVPQGSRIVGFAPAGKQGLPVLVARTPGGKLAVMAGNFGDSQRTVTLRLGKKYLNMTLAPHSLNTFAER